MPWKGLSALAAALVLTGALAANAAAQRWDRDGDRWERGGDRRDRDDDRRDRGGDRREWVLLAERTVNFRVDRDVIDIREGEDWWRDRGFRRLHLVAERSDIHLLSLRLVYMNGYSEDIEVDRLIPDGQDQPIDLRGERKYLRRIEFVYRSRRSFEGRAIMKVYGVPARFRPGPGPQLPPIGPGRDAEWVELGCQRVSFLGVDRDTIRVGRREGRFKALRLYVRGADIQLLDLTVIYANGSPDSLQVRSRLREGDRTRPLELRGWERSIDRIEMTYVTVPNFKGQATVCAEGLQ